MMREGLRAGKDVEGVAGEGGRWEMLRADVRGQANLGKYTGGSAGDTSSLFVANYTY